MSCFWSSVWLRTPIRSPWKNCEAHHNDHVTGSSTSSSVGFISGLSTCVLLPQIGLTVSSEAFFLNLLWCFLNLLWWWIPYFLDHVSSGDYSLVFLERTWENLIIHSPNIYLFNSEYTLKHAVFWELRIYQRTKQMIPGPLEDLIFLWVCVCV